MVPILVPLSDCPAALSYSPLATPGPPLRFYESWASYALLERSLRHIKEARGVYKRAYSRKLEEGGQVALCADWLKFEREEGGPEDCMAAALKAEPILEEAAAAAAAAADSGAAAVAKVTPHTLS